MNSKDFRDLARQDMKNNSNKLVLVCLIFFAINVCLNLIPFIGSLGSTFITGPLLFGCTLISLKVIKNEDFEVKDIFKGFDHFLNSFLLYLLNTIFVVLWSLLLIIPGIIKGLSYAMSYYILVENPDMDANDARLKSMEIMEGHKWDLFKLYFSFIGWFILVGLTLGILGLWVIPYVQISITHFYDSIKQKDEPIIETVEQTVL